MLGQLEDAIDNLELHVDGAALAHVISLRDRLDAKIASAVAEFDAAALWDLDAATSMTAWLRHHTKTGSREAARLTATAKRVAGLPETAATWRDGQLSSGQVAAIVANTSEQTAAAFAEVETELIPALAELSADDTAQAMRHWKALADDDIDGNEPERSVHLSPTLGGRWRLDGELDSHGGQTVNLALRLASAADTACPKQRRGDALVEIAAFFVDHHGEDPGHRNRPHLNVVVDINDLERGTYIDGQPADGPTVGALLCDSQLHRIVMSGRSTILDYGTSTRTITPALWAALTVRDRHCRFDGCDRPAAWGDAHHVVHVEHGGATRPDNLVVLCRRHHRRLHQPGWHAKLLPDGTFEVTQPDGTTRATRPPGTLW